MPITKDLAELLLDLPSEGYLIAPEKKNREVISNYLTTCFNHFWQAAGLRKGISFKHLRKTYITRINLLLGADKTKSLGYHSDFGVQIKHYVEKKEIQKELLNQRMF